MVLHVHTLRAFSFIITTVHHHHYHRRNTPDVAESAFVYHPVVVAVHDLVDVPPTTLVPGLPVYIGKFRGMCV